MATRYHAEKGVRGVDPLPSGPNPGNFCQYRQPTLGNLPAKCCREFTGKATGLSWQTHLVDAIFLCQIQTNREDFGQDMKMLMAVNMRWHNAPGLYPFELGFAFTPHFQQGNFPRYIF